MSIFTNLFGKKKDEKVKVTQSKLVNLFTPYFSSTVDPKANETFMAGVDTHALHLSKIKPTVYFKGKKDKEYMNKILTLKPNPVMEAGAFWEKVARLYWTELNVFIYIDWDLFNQNEPLKSLWIIDTENVETSIDKSTGEFYLRFYIQGKVITTGLDNIIHIARNVGDTEIFGEKNNAINTVLRVINTNNDGIENAIKTSAFLRFVINSTTSLTDKQREKKAQNFADSYLKVGGTGVAYMDASSQLTQIKSDAKYSNADEMKFFENKIYNFLHISENIIKGDFSENQWQSYYETNIETFANKLCNELNFKLFTKRQYDVGNRVQISTSDLQVVSIASKINLVDKTKEIGLYTINEFRELFNLPPVENGGERMVSLNYINSSIANEYQQSKLKNEGGKKDEK